MLAVLILIVALSGCTVTDITGSTAQEEKDSVQAGAGEKQEVQAQEEPKPAAETPAKTGDSMYEVACNGDSDCGETIYGEKYCFQNGIVTPITKNICMNPGSIKSYCRKEMRDEVVMCIEGREVCRNGKCLVLAELPCTDSDGGKNYEEAGTVLDAELIEYKDNCLDKGTVIEYYCLGGNKGLARDEKHYCIGGKCITGACVED